MAVTMPLSEKQQELVTANLRLPIKVAHRWFWEWLARNGDDLISTGNVALCIAAIKFEDDRRCSFKTWAIRGIHRAVRDEVRRIVRRQRIPEENRDPLAWENERGREAGIEHVRCRIPDVIAVLAPKEWDTISAICGFNGEPVTQSEYARASGVSRQAVSDSMTRAVAKSQRVIG